MKIYVRGMDLVLESEISEKELSVLIQASRRGLLEAKILVVYRGEKRKLDIRAVDCNKSLPGYVMASLQPG